MEVSRPQDSWLLVEDDDNDFLFFRRACGSAFSKPPLLHRECDGFAAKTFLSANAELPGLIVSDLMMPRMDGLQLLQWVRGQPRFEPVPFVLLSSSDFERDRAESLGADDYFVKPASHQDRLL